MVIRSIAVLAAILAVSPLLPAAPAQEPPAAEQFRVLVFTRTTGFRHPSIPDGIAAIRRLGREHGFGVHATEEPRAFTDENLRRYAAVVFLSTTGTVLEGPQKSAFERYIRAGGGYVGIHSAADTEYDWPFYGRLIGAYFQSHPAPQSATLVREDVRHPATAHLEPRSEVFDEFYSFRRNPRQDAHVLLSIDESTYSPGAGAMGDHPMSWCHDIGRGRAFYTALGHEPALYSQRWYRRHLLGGIRAAVRRVAADCSPPGALRLTRRCLRDGRLRVRVSGDTRQVRRVSFKLGRRLVFRDGQAPFAGTIGRRTLERTGARRLRAVAERRDARPVVLSRTLPACA